jgi:hypothetical protein
MTGDRVDSRIGCCDIPVIGEPAMRLSPHRDQRSVGAPGTKSGMSSRFERPGFSMLSDAFSGSTYTPTRKGDPGPSRPKGKGSVPTPAGGRCPPSSSATTTPWGYRASRVSRASRHTRDLENRPILAPSPGHHWPFWGRSQRAAPRGHTFGVQIERDCSGSETFLQGSLGAPVGLRSDPATELTGLRLLV